jgi:hypothetical protein
MNMFDFWQGGHANAKWMTFPEPQVSGAAPAASVASLAIRSVDKMTKGGIQSMELDRSQYFILQYVHCWPCY